MFSLRTFFRRFAFPISLALVSLLANLSSAEQLRVDLVPEGARARNGSPIPVDVKFKWDSTRILEGRLDMQFLDGNRVLGQYRSGDLALTGGDQSFRMLFPPATAPFSDTQVEVRMRFLTGGKTIELDPAALFVPASNERSLVVAWTEVSTAAGQGSLDIAKDLRLERFAPGSATSAQSWLMTSLVRLAPEDLPVQPLGYTCFDVVVLTKDSFKAASERQLQALTRWVRGGGSVCVFATGGLQPHHLSFLNQLAESETGPMFQADSEGNLISTPQNILFLHSGVGRSVIVMREDAMDSASNTDSWRNVSTFLWKVRPHHARSIMDSGSWDSSVNSTANYNYNRVFRQPPYGHPFPRQPVQMEEQASYNLGPELLSRLMPQTVRLIPFSALFGMLVLFVILIGPADYFLLGFIKRRRLTWILFPITSLAFTIATVLMANHYLGLRDQRRSLIVVDMARDGTALRWNRYELVFAARDKESKTELKNALWAPLDAVALSETINYPSGSSTTYPYNQARRAYRPGVGADLTPPLYDGVLPVHYQVTEKLRQWQPKLNRTFSFDPPPAPLLDNWPAIEAAWPDLHKIRATLSEKKPFPGGVWSVSGPGNTSPRTGASDILSQTILEGLCVGNSEGLLNLVSQISPTGGGDFEDAQALDTDANDSALVIATQNGDDIVVYRRFFYGD